MRRYRRWGGGNVGAVDLDALEDAEMCPGGGKRAGRRRCVLREQRVGGRAHRLCTE